MSLLFRAGVVAASRLAGVASRPALLHHAARMPARIGSLSSVSAPCRKLHFGLPMARIAGVDQVVDLTKTTAPQNHWFTEAHSLPDIHQFMRRLAGSSMNVYNVTLGARTPNQLKGLKICAQNRRPSVTRNQIVILGGHQAHEWTATAVALYVASCLARRPLPNTDVIVLPMINPTQYEICHQAGILATTPLSTSSLEFAPLRSSPHEHMWQHAEPDVTTSPGPIKNYINKLKNSFVRVVQDLQTGRVSSTFQALHQNANPGFSLNPFFSPFTNTPTLGAFGEGSLFSSRNVSNYVIELRDKKKMLPEDQIVNRGEEIFAGILHLMGEGAEESH
eukprot:TRINITY_DN3832_c0_g1_i1.p1 TRINITY_DN3832_c0_g1~~TRINITY_DN3832_c0_g1_i1.p1  ORF type:complete len:334 (+),score=87.90 TRINITY_DN3832_c0_g1_i1:108-1109(+)